MRDGSVGLSSFSDANLHDLELRSLMQRISISHNSEFTERFPEELVSRLTVTTRPGRAFVVEGTYPKGHVRNPATPADVDAKFDRLASEVVRPKRRDEIRAGVARIQDCEDVSALVDALVWTTG